MRVTCSCRETPGESAGKCAEGVLGDTADAEHDAGVLHGVVRVKQPRADRADLWPLHMLGHDREPFALDHFDVVVQEKEPRAVALLDREIIERGKIEGAIELQEAMFEVPEIFVRFLRLALVIDDDDLVVRVARFVGDARRCSAREDRSGRASR